MQVTKSFSGTLDNLGSSSARQVSYGATATESTYWNRNDFLNQTIADFLHDDCGVDAAYEVRAGSSNKFLWIYDVPFLFSETTISTSSGQQSRFYGPLNGATLYYAVNRCFASASSNTYNFKLNFCGNPSNGFCLRFVLYGTSIPNSGYKFVFCKAKNMLTQKDSVVFKYSNVTPTSNILILNAANAIDINEDRSIDEISFNTDHVPYTPVLQTKNAIKADSGGKFPLVPLTFGIWKTTGFYLHPKGFGLPNALAASNEVQTEVSISGRRFIVTTLDDLKSSYINCGLIEVND